MPNTISGTQSVVIDNETYTQAVNGSSDSELSTSPSVPAAAAGDLTTRTSDTVGTLTMDSSGHGIATGDEFSIFWDGGSRWNVTAGTVAGASIPFTLGSGDNLPDDEAPITAMKGTSVPFSAIGDNVDAIGSHSPVSGVVEYMNGATVLLAHQILPNLGNGLVWQSGIEHAATNPLAGVTVTDVRFTHGDSTQAQTMRAAVAY